MSGIKPGDVVQVVDERPGLIGAFLLVEEVRPWGVRGFVHHVEDFENNTAIYLRLSFGQVEQIGKADLVPQALAGEQA